MTQELLLGAMSLAIATGLIFIGLPDKSGVSPRFLRFQTALVIYPATILIFVAGGIAELITALLRNPL